MHEINIREWSNPNKKKYIMTKLFLCDISADNGNPSKITCIQNLINEYSLKLNRKNASNLGKSISSSNNLWNKGQLKFVIDSNIQVLVK